jgi:hypothetical protein
VIWFIFSLIAAFFVVYAILPFFDKNYRNKHLPGSTGERENLLLRKEEVLTALNDLEYDFRMKKIGEPDYLQTKEILTREAIDLMKSADELAAPAKTQAQTSDASRAKVKS